jgi:hypothetical protein
MPLVFLNMSDKKNKIWFPNAVQMIKQVFWRLLGLIFVIDSAHMSTDWRWLNVIYLVQIIVQNIAVWNLEQQKQIKIWLMREFRED